MNIFEHFEQHLTEAVKALVAEGALPADIVIPRLLLEPTREASHGDLAANAAMMLAKPAGKKPRELAEAIAAKLAKVEGHREDGGCRSRLHQSRRLIRSFWTKVVGAIVRAGKSYGRSELGRGKKVNVEYVSANPTGPLHVGHCRGAVFGDALASLLAFTGHEVTREYYTNDAGSQIDVLARSVLPALPRGAGRGHRRDPRGALSRRLSEAGRRGARRSSTARRCLEKPESEWLPLDPRLCGRRHARAHQGTIWRSSTSTTRSSSRRRACTTPAPSLRRWRS